MQDPIRMVYGGTLYSGSFKWLKEVDLLLMEMGDKVVFDVYALNNDQLSQLHLQKIRVHGRISEEDLYREIAASDVYLALYPDMYKDFVSTKFMEIIALRRPIILISRHGDLSRFITGNHLGYHIVPERIKDLKTLLEKSKGSWSEWKVSFPVEKYSTDFLSGKLMKMFGIAS